ncbi:uncharacterized protein [Montipora capricornis]|uniref:uncharacterized protein n=1 Tax=Montipora capricornis TaxID=246305 RepID=UPI0035F13181
MASEYNEELLALLLILLLRRRRRKRQKDRPKAWARNWISRSQLQGAYPNLLRELNTEDPEAFRQFHRLDRESFDTILAKIAPLITKKDTLMRRSIPPGEKLSITLRFLATGEKFSDLAFLFRRGERTLSQAVFDTCEALFTTMKTEYLKVPDTADQWEKVAREFNNKWNYPCCIGALDGKHIAIQQPPNSGSEFFNYKHFFSVLLLALVDANYKFLYVDVGAPGRAGDAGVFAGSSLKQALERNTLNIPPAKTIEGIPSPVDYHIVGDDAFPLSKNIMKPYPQRNLDKAKRIFNYRLSRARRVVENAFGILANRFRVFLTTIKLNDEKVVTLILAACCLHNFMVETNKSAYLSAQEIENTDQHTITAGTWRNDPPLTGLSTSSVRNPAHAAKQQGKEITEYFMSELGSVPWQDHMITH